MSSKFLKPILLATTECTALTSNRSDSTSCLFSWLRSSLNEVILFELGYEVRRLLLWATDYGWMHL